MVWPSLKKEQKWFDAELEELRKQDEAHVASIKDAGKKAIADTRATRMNRFYRLFMVRRLMVGDLQIRRARLFGYVWAWLIGILWFLLAIVGLVAIAWAMYQILDEGILDKKVFAGLGGGGAELLLFLFFRPTEKIKRMIGDLMQLEIIVSSFQHRVGLTLLAYKREDENSVKAAATRIGEIGFQHVKLIEAYFRVHETTWVGRIVGGAVTDAIGPLKGDIEDILDDVKGELEGKLDTVLSEVKGKAP